MHLMNSLLCLHSAILNSHFLSSFGNNTSHQDIDFSGERPMQVCKSDIALFAYFFHPKFIISV